MANASTSTPPATSPATSFQVPSLSNTYGALYIGMCFGLALYGLTFHQTYRYFRLYPKDSGRLKILIIVIFVSETLHTIMPVHLCYFHLVQNYFNPVALELPSWSLRFLAPVSLVSMIACQSYYTHRVYRVDPRYRWIVMLIVVLLVTELGFMIVLVVEAFRGQHLTDFLALTWIVSVVYGIALAIDSLNTGLLIVYLLRNKTGFKSTDSVIQTLVVYTINTGLLNSVFGVMCFLFALIISGNEIYVAVGIVATKLYAISVLAVLNARQFLSSQAIDGFDTHSIMFNNSMGCTHCSGANSSHRTFRQTVNLSLPVNASRAGPEVDDSSLETSGPETRMSFKNIPFSSQKQETRGGFIQTV